MSQTEAGVLVVAVFGLIAIVVLFRFRNARIKIKGPGKLGMDVDASDPPAIRAEDVNSRKGGITATDETGRGIDANKVEVEKDIQLKVERPGPKA